MNNLSPLPAIDNKITQIDEKLNYLTQTLIQIQDVILTLKAEIEIITREDLERNNCARVVTTASETLGAFLKERNSRL